MNLGALDKNERQLVIDRAEERGGQFPGLIVHGRPRPGEQVPKEADPPQVFPRWSWVMEAHNEMQGDRLGAMGGVKPTPFLVLDRYAERLGLEGEEYETFRRLIRELDAEESGHYAERVERERRASGKP